MNPLLTPVIPLGAFDSAQAGAQAFGAEPGLHVSLSQVLAAMSRALDLTEGQSPGHTVRTCVIGMRLADEIGLSTFDRVALYGALLLKDAGRSGNSPRISEILERPRTPPRRHYAQRPANAAQGAAIREAIPRGLRARIGQLLKLRPNAPADVFDDVPKQEGMALRLGFSRATADAIHSIHERWNGSGIPDGLVGHEIPQLSRIILLAQTLDALFVEHGVNVALRVAREQSGLWFDPALVRVVRGWREDKAWWDSLVEPGVTALALSVEPAQHHRFVDGKGLDDVAKAFAEIIDSKSRFTWQHSTNVAKYARATGFEMGFTRDQLATLNRAALLHDVGKLGVSSRILEKAGPLTSSEREEMQRHPIYTWEILQRVSAFAGFARTAALHHEKLDGSGYPWGVTGDELDTASRILCVADMYEALTANRPYRAGLSRDAALQIISAGSGKHVCPEATAALGEATRNLRVAMAS
ncbi:MAG TPA: HD domain-containing phosphohydrolase [Gemmatimonadaceae bacterium]|nr:HD domain-containing phosphohydrolase [Gemmatimonadaceae bacterium]